METIARDSSERGEVRLMRREDGSRVLRVNGIFVMDSAEHSSERVLATAALLAIDHDSAARQRGRAPSARQTPGHQPVGQQAPGLHVVVAGLGLGSTLAAVLDDTRVGRVSVVEIEPAVVRWHREGLIAAPTADRARGELGAALDDPRVTAVVGDIRTELTSLTRPIDVILLDVDNGPGFLVYDTNVAVYQSPFLAQCADVVSPGGVVAIWTASPDHALDAILAAIFEDVTRNDVQVELDRHRTSYHVVTARRRTLDP